MSLSIVLFHSFVLPSLLGLTALWCLNVRRLQPHVSGSPWCDLSPPPALVSILIPARNEAASIGECLRSLQAQEYPALEILVLDDGSTDGTAAVVAAAARNDARLRVLTGESLPAGWTGKAWACRQLAQSARGDWLLFVDADTRHASAMVRTAVILATERERDCFTTWPHLEAETLAERALIPLLPSLLFLYLPVALVEDSPDPRFAAANGQFMLFRRECYEAVGGHDAVRGSLVDDVSLARLVKRHGFQLGFFDSTSLASCRMYRGFRELWQGFSKNLYPGLGASVAGALLFATLNLLWFVAPPALLTHALLAGTAVQEWALPALETGLMLGVNASLARRFRQAWWFPLAFPFSILTMLALLGHSAWRFRTGRGAEWKGRVYHASAGGGSS